MSFIFNSGYPMGFDGSAIESEMATISTDSNGAGSTTINFQVAARNHQWSADYRIGYAIEADSFCDVRYDEPSSNSVGTPDSVDVYIQNAPASSTVEVRVTRFIEASA